MHDLLLWARAVTAVLKIVAYASMSVSFLRWRVHSIVKAVCVALAINFALGDVMTIARLAAIWLPLDHYLTWAEIAAALITCICAWSVRKSVGRT